MTCHGKVIVELAKDERSMGLTYVQLSRTVSIENLLINPTVELDRITEKISRSHALQDRIKMEEGLKSYWKDTICFFELSQTCPSNMKENQQCLYRKRPFQSTFDETNVSQKLHRTLSDRIPSPKRQISFLSSIKPSSLLEDKNQIWGFEEGIYFSDQNINAFNAVLKNHIDPSIHIFSTFFYTKLMNDQMGDIQKRRIYDYNRVRRWGKKVNGKQGLFSLKILIIPVNISNIHWALTSINFDRKQIFYYDPLNGDGQEIRKNLSKYIEDEYLSINGEILSTIEEKWDSRDIHSPTQPNNYDCGPYCCIFSYLLACDKPLINYNYTLIRQRIKSVVESRNINF